MKYWDTVALVTDNLQQKKTEWVNLWSFIQDVEKQGIYTSHKLSAFQV